MPVENVWGTFKTADIGGAITNGYTAGVKAKTERQNQAENEIKLSDLARDRDENLKIKSLYTQHTGEDGKLDQDGFLRDMATINPEKQMKYQDAFRKRDGDELELKGKKLESQINQLGAVGSLAMGAKDQGSYETALSRASEMGLDVSKMPKQFDPNLMRTYAFNSMKQAERLSVEKENHDQMMAGRNADETARHNRAGESHQRNMLDQNDRHKVAEMTGNARLADTRGMQQIDQINARGRQDRMTKETLSGDGSAKLAAENDPYQMTTEAKLKKLNGTDKARIDNVRMAYGGIQSMGEALAKGDNTFSVVGDNNFTMAERDFTEALGRMQSGGAISRQEEKRFAAMAPKLMDNMQIRQEKLQRLQAEMGDRFRTLGFDASEFGFSGPVAQIEGAPNKNGGGESLVKDANAAKQWDSVETNPQYFEALKFLKANPNYPRAKEMLEKLKGPAQ